MGGRVSFVGAGPGVADLITFRGARRIADADVVLWPLSTVAADCVREHAGRSAEMIDSSRLTDQQLRAIYERAARDGLSVVSLHAGDAVVGGEVTKHKEICRALGLDSDVVPGISTVTSTMSAVETHGEHGDVPSVVVTRLDSHKAPMPPGQRVHEYARHGATMVISASAARVGLLVEELRRGGYDDDTPVSMVDKPGTRSEVSLTSTVGGLVAAVRQHRLWRQVMFVVGAREVRPFSQQQLATQEFAPQQRTAPPAERTSAPTSRRPKEEKASAKPKRTSSKSDTASSKTRNTPRRQQQPKARRAPQNGQRPAQTVRAELESERESERESAQVPNQPVKRGPGLDSDVAWWAIRRWQDSARQNSNGANRHNNDHGDNHTGNGNGATSSQQKVNLAASVTQSRKSARIPQDQEPKPRAKSPRKNTRESTNTRAKKSSPGK